MAFAELKSAATPIRIYYELTGDPALPVVVLSHALGVDHTMWEPQRQALAAHYRILSYDTRGHGQSSAPTGSYTISDLGIDVLGLLDTLCIQPVTFCGLSMGGVIGQWLAIHAPARLHKLVLSNTAAKIGTVEGWNQRIATVQSEGVRPGIPATLERWFTEPFRTAQPATVASIQRLLEATNPQAFAACCAALRDADFRESIQSIQTPTLVIAGTSDAGTTTSDAQFLSKGIPNSTYVELPAAHLSSVECAKAFNQSLLNFLSN
jgi:3-oxoadipate enol-lactonase